MVAATLLVALLGVAPLAAQPLPQWPSVGELIDKQKSSIRDRCPLGYAFRDKKLVCVEIEGGGGGDITTDTGAARTGLYLADEVTTVAGQSSVSTSETIPAQALIERCLARTTVAVPGGYHLGIAGGRDLWGKNISGSAGGTNEDAPTLPGGHPVFAETAIIVTAAGGTFSTNGGKVRIFCPYQTYTAPGMP